MSVRKATQSIETVAQPVQSGVRPAERYTAPVSDYNPEGDNNVLQSIAMDPLKTLLVKPAIRTGQAVGGLIAKGLGADPDRLNAALDKNVDLNFGPLGKMRIEPVKKGSAFETAKDLGGDVLKTASYLAPVGKVGNAVTGIAKGNILKSAASGAIAGGIGGGLYGTGAGLQEEGNTVTGALTQGAVGAGYGAAAGGVLGGVGGAMGKYNRRADIVKEASEDYYRDVFQQNQKEMLKDERLGRDTIKFIADRAPLLDSSGKKVNASKAIIKFSKERNLVGQELDTLLKDTGASASLESAKKAAQQAAESRGLSNKAKLELLSEIDDLFNSEIQANKGTTELPLDAMRRIKTAFAEGAYSQYGTAKKDAETIAAKAVDAVMRDALKNAHPQYLERFADLNDLYGTYIDSIKLMSKTHALPSTFWSSLTGRTIGTLGGYHVGGVPGAAIGNVLEDQFSQAVSNPRLRTEIVNSLLKATSQAPLTIDDTLARTKLYQPKMDFAQRTGMENVSKNQSSIFDNTNKALQGQVTQKYSPTNTTSINNILDDSLAQASDDVNAGTKSLAEDLISQAKKYKSAEEFVKAQGKPLFHAGTADIAEVKLDKSNFDKTFYLSDNSDYAKSFGGKKSVINEMVVDPKANLADMRKPSLGLVTEIEQRLKKENAVFSDKAIVDGIKAGKAHFAELPEVKKALRELGYDGQITAEVPYAKNIGVWNKDVIKTKSQLTDIWKQATTKTGNDTDKVTMYGVGTLGLTGLSGGTQAPQTGSVQMSEYEKGQLQNATTPIDNAGKLKDASESIIDTTTATQTTKQERDLKPHIQEAYKLFPSLPKGMIEMVLEMESMWGTNKTKYDPTIGEYAWLAGVTDSAKKDLAKRASDSPIFAKDEKGKYKYKNIKDVSTKEAAILNMAAYLDLMVRKGNNNFEARDKLSGDPYEAVDAYEKLYKTLSKDANQFTDEHRKKLVDAFKRYRAKHIVEEKSLKYTPKLNEYLKFKQP